MSTLSFTIFEFGNKFLISLSIIFRLDKFKIPIIKLRTQMIIGMFFYLFEYDC